MRYFRRRKKNSGFSLVEALVGIAVFTIVVLAVYQGYITTLEGVRVSRIKISATTLANEQFELIRNIPYDNIGTIGGVPSGVLDATTTVIKNGNEFTVVRTIRNIDDPADGTFGGSPDDEYPIDSKLVEIEISCEDCDFDPVTYTTRIAPASLEELGDNGILIIQVYDAFGQSLQGADVHIENNSASTTISIDDTTDSNGILKIIGLEPGTEVYEITVTKDGYSTDKTYAPGDPSNPVPDKPHSNVLSGQITQISFAIDELSTLVLNTKDETCGPIGNVDIDINGSKTIGLNVFKYDQTITTNGSGVATLNNMEWDTYSISVNDSSYYLAGSNPNTQLELNPDTTQSIDLIVEPQDPNGVMFQVIDSGTSLPLAGALITMDNGATTTDTTGRGSLFQSDWSGGSGQQNFTDITKYFSSDGNIDDSNPSGEIKLVEFAGDYVSSGSLESSTFDTGTTTNFHVINWEPQNTTPSTTVKFQFSTSNENNATTTWSFIGPDGTGSSYYTSSGANLHSSHADDRYYRYKVFLETTDDTVTPTISDVSAVFSGDCVPTGEALITGLSNGTYDITVDLSGYTSYNDPSFNVSAGWERIDVLLTEL